MKRGSLGTLDTVRNEGSLAPSVTIDDLGSLGTLGTLRLQGSLITLGTF